MASRFSRFCFSLFFLQLERSLNLRVSHSTGKYEIQTILRRRGSGPEGEFISDKAIFKCREE